MSFLRPAATLTATGWPAIIILGIIVLDALKGAYLLASWLFSFQ